MNKRKRYKKERTLLDIVIPVYGRFDLLEQCLEAIPKAANSIHHQIILVDNDSPIGLEPHKFYAGIDESIEVIRNSSNFGFPRACNQGVRKGKSPLVFLLNSDVILEENTIEKMVLDLDDPSIGVVGAHLVFPEYAGGLNQPIRPPNTTQHIGMETDIHGNWRHIFVGWSSNHPKVISRREVYAVTGAALMTRRNIWTKVGGFDEIYGVGTYEDVDFCMSVRELGYNIVVNPDAKGIHYTGATAEYYQMSFPMNENKVKFFQKWGDKIYWSEGLAW